VIGTIASVRVSTFNSTTSTSDSLLPIRMRYVGSQSRPSTNAYPLVSSIGYVFIEIDTTYLKEIMIPELAELHLQTDGSMDFNLTIANQITGDSTKVFYGSAAESKD